MKPRIQNLHISGETTIFNHKINRRVHLFRLFVLAVLCLFTTPLLEAQELPPLLRWIFDFPSEDSLGDTNDDDNTGGGEPICDLVAPLAQLGGFKTTQDTTGSSATSTLYGTASLLGYYGQGTVFAINTDGGDFTVLHDFTGGKDGGFSAAGLVLSGQTLFGTTENGGTNDNGNIFVINTNGTGFKVLRSFSARNQNTYTNSDGANPAAALIIAGNRLYGVTQVGGNKNSGTVFSINTNGTGFTVLHSFSATAFDSNFNLTNADGSNPRARLFLSGSTLYGTATAGGAGGAGTVFAVNTNGSGFEVLHVFPAVDYLTLTNTDGVSPYAGLILSGNTLYGTASAGGMANSGTVFAVGTNGVGFTNLYNFTGGSDGGRPVAALTLSSNKLYGTAGSGGNSGSGGTLFTLNLDGTGFTVLHSFSNTIYGSDFNPTNTEGARPQGSVIIYNNVLYGTASGGGSAGEGTLYSFSLSSAPQVTILGAVPVGINLTISGANGQSGATYVTLVSSNLSLPLSEWMPQASNTLSASGNFTFIATNVVDVKAPRRFYILKSQ